MTRRIVVTCDGCGETWEAAPGMLGALCGQGQVREATPAEADWYVAGIEPSYGEAE